MTGTAAYLYRQALYGLPTPHDAIDAALYRLEWLEARLEDLDEWVEAAGAERPVAPDLDEDEARELGEAGYVALVDAFEAAVDALEAEAADEPLRPHPSSPWSEEQVGFRAAAGF